MGTPNGSTKGEPGLCIGPLPAAVRAQQKGLPLHAVPSFIVGLAMASRALRVVGSRMTGAATQVLQAPRH